MPRGPTFGANTEEGACSPPYCRRKTTFTSLGSNFGAMATERRRAVFWAGETNLWSHGGIMEVARWRGWGRNSPPRSQNGHMIMGFSGMAERKFKNLPGFYHILQARASRALASQ